MLATEPSGRNGNSVKVYQFCLLLTPVILIPKYPDITENLVRHVISTRPTRKFAECRLLCYEVSVYYTDKINQKDDGTK